jgi:hypothetical protein
MAIEIITVTGGLFAIKVSGKLKKSELDQVQKAAIDVINKGAKGRCLVIAEAFEGWERASDWGDLSFESRYDQKIEKIAIVSSKRWVT